MSSFGADPTGVAFGQRSHCHANPRLLPSWDHYPVCGLELSGGQSPGPDGSTAPPPGMAALPQETGRRNACRANPAPDCGQLLNTQTSEGADLAGETQPPATKEASGPADGIAF